MARSGGLGLGLSRLQWFEDVNTLSFTTWINRILGICPNKHLQTFWTFLWKKSLLELIEKRYTLTCFAARFRFFSHVTLLRPALLPGRFGHSAAVLYRCTGPETWVSWISKAMNEASCYPRCAEWDWSTETYMKGGKWPHEQRRNVGYMRSIWVWEWSLL